MDELYFGTVGKDSSYGLLSGKRIVMICASRGEILAFDTIGDAEKAYRDGENQELLFWDSGAWHKVNFLIERGLKKITGYAA